MGVHSRGATRTRCHGRAAGCPAAGRVRASDQSQEIVGARQLLQLLGRLPAIRTGDGPRCAELVERLLAEYPSYNNINVMRPDGDVGCSAPPARPRMNLADRAYFQRAAATRDLAAGDFIRGRITGKPTIDFAYRLMDDSGRITHMLALGIDLTWLKQALASGQWPPNTTLTLIDQGGTIVASYPDAARIGQSVGDRPAIQTVLARREGVARDVERGEPYLLGYAATDGGTQAADVHVVVGVPEAVAFAAADADQQLSRNLALLGLATRLALVAGWALGDRLLVRPITQLVGPRSSSARAS